jgi:hypothetical protein
MPVFTAALFANKNFAVGIEGELRRPEHFKEQDPAARRTAGGRWRFDKDTHGLYPFTSALGAAGTKNFQRARLFRQPRAGCSGSTGVAKFWALKSPRGVSL